MLIVYVQEAGGPNDALREALRGRDEFKGVYMEGMPPPGVLELARADGRLRVVFPERGLHPEDQANAGRTLARLAIDIDVTVATHALPVLHAFNNGLAAYPALTIQAYAVSPVGTLRSIMGDDQFIDERPLGRATDILAVELNQLCAARRVQRDSSSLDTCPLCASPYVHIGHPLKPGVIMQSRCACVVQTTRSMDGTVTVGLVPPKDQ